MQWKIDAGVYEPSNALYQSRWFTVTKKDGKSLWIVHSLEPLNAVTIAHLCLPPTTEELALQFAGRACGGMFDLYVEILKPEIPHITILYIDDVLVKGSAERYEIAPRQYETIAKNPGI